MLKQKFNSDFFLGLGGLLAGGLILLIWIPLDVETGLIEKVRGRVVIGDALAPSLAASIFILGGLLTGLQSFRTRGGVDLTWNSLKFMILLMALLGLSMAIMRWAGPIAAHLFQADYRSLRATIPWKYVGYFLGGIVMIFGLIGVMEHRLRWRILIISIVAVLAMILIYDVPFENLLLPPNGDF